MSTQRAPTAPGVTALLLSCAHTRVNTDAAGRLRDLALPDTDWISLVTLAEYHDIAPLVYHILSTVLPDLTPGTVLGQMKEDNRRSALASLIQARELLRVLRALAERGVAALPYKGPVLAEMAYGNLSLRHSIDLDVLVRRQDMGAAQQALAAIGYALDDECRLHQQAYAHAHHHLVLRGQRSNVTIELHWHTVTPQFSFNLSFDQLWQNSVMTSLAGQAVRSPAVEDTLLLVCVHASMHGWKQLKQICDVAELLQRYPALDGQALLARARSLGVWRMLALGLSLAGSCLDATLPALLSAESDPVVQRLADGVRLRLANAQSGEPAPDERSFSGYYALLRERRHDRANEALRRIFIPNMEDWAALPLPERLWFLHYVIRPLRLLHRLTATLLHR